MKISIIIYSQTGNTNSVAQKLKEQLAKTGNSVEFVQLKVVGQYQPGQKDIRFESLPDIGKSDAVIFAAPVQGFSVSPIMIAYLNLVTSLQNKKVACFVTQHFPYAWMGGSRAISQMKAMCKSKGSEVCGTGIINWSRSNREQRITEVVESLSKLF